jgi:hypothetical protein
MACAPLPGATEAGSQVVPRRVEALPAGHVIHLRRVPGPGRCLCPHPSRGACARLNRPSFSTSAGGVWCGESIMRSEGCDLKAPKWCIGGAFPSSRVLRRRAPRSTPVVFELRVRVKSFRCSPAAACAHCFASSPSNTPFIHQGGASQPFCPRHHEQASQLRRKGSRQ